MASHWKLARISRRRYPIARRTAISEVRPATAEYMVFMAAKTAPTVRIAVMIRPRTCMGLPASLISAK